MKPGDPKIIGKVPMLHTHDVGGGETRLSPLDASTEAVMRDMLLEFGLNLATVEKMILAMDPSRLVIYDFGPWGDPVDLHHVAHYSPEGISQATKPNRKKRTQR